MHACVWEKHMCVLIVIVSHCMYFFNMFCMLFLSSFCCFAFVILTKNAAFIQDKHQNHFIIPYHLIFSRLKLLKYQATSLPVLLLCGESWKSHFFENCIGQRCFKYKFVWTWEIIRQMSVGSLSPDLCLYSNICTREKTCLHNSHKKIKPLFLCGYVHWSKIA